MNFMPKSLAQKSKLLDEKFFAETMSNAGDRCTGHCCKNLCLTVSPEELKSAYLRKDSKFEREESFMSINESKRRLFGEIELIYPMLRFKRVQGWHEDAGDLSAESYQQEFPNRKFYVYECVHFDSQKKECGIYDIRPVMCRIHGDTGCGYKGCTYKPAVQRTYESRKEAANEIEVELGRMKEKCSEDRGE